MMTRREALLVAAGAVACPSAALGSLIKPEPPKAPELEDLYGPFDVIYLDSGRAWGLLRGIVAKPSDKAPGHMQLTVCIHRMEAARKTMYEFLDTYRPQSQHSLFLRVYRKSKVENILIGSAAVEYVGRMGLTRLHDNAYFEDLKIVGTGYRRCVEVIDTDGASIRGYK